MDDADNRVYVTDPGNGRIQVFNTSGEYLFEWASWDDGSETQFLGNITGIGSDGQGTIYVAAEGNLIKFTAKLDRNIIYVDADATAGAKNGLDWANAYTDLQDAFDQAAVDERIDQIWVAEGTYAPAPPGGGGGGQTESFQLINGVAVYGGFVGNENSLDQRDWIKNKTILSCDIERDDQPDSPQTRDDNCYHVVTTADTDATAELDGFRIQGGGEGNDLPGAGILNIGGSPTILHCLIRDNLSNDGGGMANDGGSPTVVSCAFVDNGAFVGGAIHNANGSNGTFANCVIAANNALDAAGMYNESSNPTLVNCTFAQNHSENAPAGFLASGGAPELTNCVFWGNFADEGGPLEPQQIYDDAQPGEPIVTYSCIEGLDTYGSEPSNIGDDPRFRGFFDYDVRLSVNSPCRNTGSNDAVTGTSDFIDHARIIEDTVDMGAFEFNLCDYSDNGVVCKQDMIWFLFALDCAGPAITPSIIGETWSTDTLMVLDSDDDADLDLADFQNAQACFGPLFDFEQCPYSEYSDFDFWWEDLFEIDTHAGFDWTGGLVCVGGEGAMMPPGGEGGQDVAEDGEASPPSDPWVRLEAPVVLKVTKLGGDEALTELSPDSEYEVHYSADWDAVDGFVAFSISQSAEQGVVAATAPPDGPWADSGLLLFLELAGEHDEAYEGVGEAPHSAVLNESVSSDEGSREGGTTAPNQGHLFSFTTGGPGTFALELFMYRLDETHQLMVEMYTVADFTVIAEGGASAE